VVAVTVWPVALSRAVTVAFWRRPPVASVTVPWSVFVDCANDVETKSDAKSASAARRRRLANENTDAFMASLARKEIFVTEDARMQGQESRWFACVLSGEARAVSVV